MKLNKNIKKLILPVCLFLFSILLYAKTLLPGVGFWDTGEFQTIAYTFDVAHPTGYPTYIILGKIFISIFPFGEIAWRMNLLSAIYVSLGIAIFGILLHKITQNSLISFSLGVMLAITPILWKVAIVADPHSLHFLFASVFLLLAYRIINEKKSRLLPALYFITGLSLGNHLLSAFLLPPLLFITITLRKKRNFIKLVRNSIFLLLIGLSVYLTLFLISAVKPPLTSDYGIRTILDLKRLVLGQDFATLMGTWAKGAPIETLSFYGNLIKDSFPYLFFVFIPFGLFLQFKRDVRFAFVTLLFFIGSVYFSLRYQNAAIERYFIVPQAIFVVWISYVFAYLRGIFNIKFADKKNGNLFSIIYSILILFSSAIFIFQNYKSIDQSKNVYADEWSKDVLKSLKPNSIVFSWWSYSTPLWYQQKVSGLRKDVLIINKSTSEWEDLALGYIEKRPIYFIQSINLKNPKLKLEESGNIYYLMFSENHP